jgi:hypothetical protein
MTALVEELVPDDLWAMVEPLLPPPPRPWWGGRVRTIHRFDFHRVANYLACPAVRRQVAALHA